MVEVYKDIDAILKQYHVKGFKVTPGEYIAVRKKGMWHYFNWSYKENGLVKTGESDRIMSTTVRVLR